MENILDNTWFWVSIAALGIIILGIGSLIQAHIENKNKKG